MNAYHPNGELTPLGIKLNHMMTRAIKENMSYLIDSGLGVVEATYLLMQVVQDVDLDRRLALQVDASVTAAEGAAKHRGVLTLQGVDPITRYEKSEAMSVLHRATHCPGRGLKAAKDAVDSLLAGAWVEMQVDLRQIADQKEDLDLYFVWSVSSLATR